MKKQKVAIVIPNYNGRDYLRGCLKSIYEFTESYIDVIVVDNASCDNSLEEIEQVGLGDRLQVIQLEKNYGFSYAVNVGIRNCQSEFVFLLNNDTVIEENTIHELVRTMELNQGIFSCAAKMIQLHNPTLIDDAGDFYNVFGWTIKRGNNKNTDRYDSEGFVFSACAGAAVYRKAVFDEIGYFDEDYFAYLEDVDIGYRAKAFGYKNFYNPKARVFHIGSATSGSKYNEFKVRISARNSIYLVWKNMPILMLLFNLPFLFLGMLIKTLFFKEKGYIKAYVGGIKEAFISVHTIGRRKFECKRLKNYIFIEMEMIVNILRYIYF